ncbi:hypothetical protein LZ554_009124 [Drepanopeziza brunnea f. sp. 'monogermtubi']|nr:hypothetical protein LZ554_009124 [Drepanopeziza brunnea f. sp. 'monogermtubi']
MVCEMDPPARESVTTMSPFHWELGTMMICVKTSPVDSQPFEPLAPWMDGDSMFYIRRRDHNDSLKSDGGDTAVDRFQECGTGGSLWKFGGEVICKVKGWCEGRQLEATTISFVRENIPQLPWPDILYSWIDAPINRTFLIMRRVHSQTLDAAWPYLSVAKRQNIAEEVACHCSRNDFVLYHPDLGPTNIMVTEDENHVSAIIDWEAAAYFPRFWVATRPASNWAFNLQGATPDEEKKGWSNLLVNALQAQGFHGLNKEFTKWSRAITAEA